jgi:chaperonin GroES
MCCLCFRRVKQEQLNITASGRKEDVCVDCAKEEQLRMTHRKSADTKQMKRQLQPLGDRVLVRRIESKSETPGGILIPSAIQEAPQEGVVLALGQGSHTFLVAVNDSVLLPKYGALEVNLNDEKLLLIKEEDILGVLRPVLTDAPPKTAADDDLDEPLGTPQACADDVCESCQ